MHIVLVYGCYNDGTGYYNLTFCKKISNDRFGFNVSMPQHLQYTFHRNTLAERHGCKRMSGYMENTFHLRNWKNIENKLVTGCELADFLYSASVIGKQFGTEY